VICVGERALHRGLNSKRGPGPLKTPPLFGSKTYIFTPKDWYKLKTVLVRFGII
jgi:hypothetical protein